LCIVIPNIAAALSHLQSPYLVALQVQVRTVGGTMRIPLNWCRLMFWWHAGAIQAEWHFLGVAVEVEQLKAVIFNNCGMRFGGWPAFLMDHNFDFFLMKLFSFSLCMTEQRNCFHWHTSAYIKFNYSLMLYTYLTYWLSIYFPDRWPPFFGDDVYFSTYH
jgi:hypothetical protein